MSGWRGRALTVGLLLFFAGIALWKIGGGPVLLVVGVVAVVTALAEPIYGRASGRPTGSNWRPTDERFVDPETGKAVTVWFNPPTGERRYVADGENGPT
jgi:hypothetical protein